jgi:Transposase, Mutator family
MTMMRRELRALLGVSLLRGHRRSPVFFCFGDLNLQETPWPFLFAELFGRYPPQSPPAPPARRYVDPDVRTRVTRTFRDVLEEVLEAEMTETLQAKPGERTAERLGLRSGSYSRTLITRVGSWSYGCRRIGRDGSARSCSSAINEARKRWSRLLRLGTGLPISEDKRSPDPTYPPKNHPRHPPRESNAVSFTSPRRRPACVR